MKVNLIKLNIFETKLKTGRSGDVERKREPTFKNLGLKQPKQAKPMQLT